VRRRRCRGHRAVANHRPPENVVFGGGCLVFSVELNFGDGNGALARLETRAKAAGGLPPFATRGWPPRRPWPLDPTGALGARPLRRRAVPPLRDA
jgi:hypothetical protein